MEEATVKYEREVDDLLRRAFKSPSMTEDEWSKFREELAEMGHSVESLARDVEKHVAEGHDVMGVLRLLENLIEKNIGRALAHPGKKLKRNRNGKN